MLQERVDRFSPETKALFADWIKSRGIKDVLFDLDDTLFDTTTHFLHHYQMYFQYAKEHVEGLDIDVFAKEFQDLDVYYYQTMGVSVTKFDQIATDLSKKYNNDSLMNGIYLVHSIYDSSPNLYDGSEDVLSLCKDVGLEIGAVTHATERWTDIKLREIGKYFKHVLVVDVEKHKHKGPEHWREAIDLFGVDPSQVMVVGDNVNGDIIAARSIGVRQLVKVETKWKVYGGNLPDGVIEVDRIGNLIPTLCIKK